MMVQSMMVRHVKFGNMSSFKFSLLADSMCGVAWREIPTIMVWAGIPEWTD